MGRKTTTVKELTPVRKKENKSDIKDEKNDFLAFTKMVNDMITSYDPSRRSNGTPKI